MTNQSDIITRLGKLGMSGYEAKAYLALVTASRPLNGYEVAKFSGVPRSTVYETLGKLVARGAAFEARSSDQAVGYLPLPPNSLLARMSAEFNDSLDALRTDLPRLAAPQEAHLIHNIVDRAALLERAADIIREARRDLFVSVWPEEFEDLRDILLEAERRGVDVMMLVFGEETAEIGRTYRHRYSSPDFVMQYLGYRLFGVVGDGRQAVVGGFRDGSGWGVFSDNPAVVLLATEYIRHDIAMQILGTQLGSDRVTDLMRSNAEFIRLRATGVRGAGGLSESPNGSAAVPLPTRRARRAGASAKSGNKGPAGRAARR